MIQNCPALFRLRKPAREIIEYIDEHLTAQREDNNDVKVARFYLQNPNPEFSKRNYSFGVKETSKGRMFIDTPHLYQGEQDLIHEVMRFIAYIPEFVEDCRN